MAAVRPDVAYDILELDVLKKNRPGVGGKGLAGRDGAPFVGRTEKQSPTAGGRSPKPEPR